MKKSRKKAEKNEKNKKNFKYFLVAEILYFVGFASFRELTETKKYWKWNFPAIKKILKMGLKKPFLMCGSVDFTGFVVNIDFKPL